jgi:integrase
MKYRDEYKDNGLVFAKKDGTYLRNGSVSKDFTKFARKIGINITFHGLRHTHCTLLIAAGVPPMFVAQRVGHKKESTTTDMYGHAKKTLGPDLSSVFKKVLKTNKAFDHDRLMEAYKVAGNLLNNVIN